MSWYALRRLDTGQLIGNCGLLKGRTSHEEPEIGYLIAEGHRGQGYATEAATALLRHCCAAGLRRVCASIHAHNAAYRHIPESVGMGLDHAEADERGDVLFYVIDLAPGSVTKRRRCRIRSAANEGAELAKQQLIRVQGLSGLRSTISSGSPGRRRHPLST